MEGEGRTLALDLGDVRVGLALSDPLGITAQPLGIHRRVHSPRDFEAVAGLVRTHQVSRVVVGHPLLLSGESGARAKDAEGFAAGLRESLPEVEVVLWDERLTTAEVERTLVAANVRRSRRKGVMDALAAVLILQGYLDAHRPPPAP